jgi:hypothetical protein
MMQLRWLARQTNMQLPREERTHFWRVDPAEAKMGRIFHIYITAGGHASYVETAENLATARKRLKQLAHNASGDCFLYSLEDGIVELIVRPELPKRLQKAAKHHIIGGRLAS